ncbi:MAG: histidinol-phosphate transaminase [Gammaproteobacteria bacterium]|nr:histidinol-phosphate transaminase [Gammaproteobacteria bacterium]
MAFDPFSLAQPGICDLQAYQPGKPVDELERELGITNIIKLASNENPLGPGPKAVSAMQAALPESSRYPDGNGFRLKQVLARRYNVDQNRITLGNGSNDVLELLARVFAGPGLDVVFSRHAFAVYPIAAMAVGANPVVVPARHWGYDLDALLASITDTTRLVFIANPNNPTGTWLNETELSAFLDAVPDHVVVVLDEAYAEYVDEPGYPDSIAWLADYPNLVVTRTFSKAYGLAALRVGYALSSVEVADLLNRVRQPFNVNALALAAAEAALADNAYLEQSVAINKAGMQQLVEGFRKLGLDYIESVGNFVCVDVAREAAPVFKALLQQGVIVRPVANYEMPNHLRVTVGTQEENQRFLAALETVLS